MCPRSIAVLRGPNVAACSSPCSAPDQVAPIALMDWLCVWVSPSPKSPDLAIFRKLHLARCRDRVTRKEFGCVDRRFAMRRASEIALVSSQRALPRSLISGNRDAARGFRWPRSRRPKDHGWQVLASRWECPKGNDVSRETSFMLFCNAIVESLSWRFGLVWLNGEKRDGNGPVYAASWNSE